MGKMRKASMALAGFLAGVAFVISCGEGARSAAEDILEAIGVTFDNSGTGLQATNVQDLGSELAARLAALEATVATIPPPADMSGLTGRVDSLEARMTLAETGLEDYDSQLATDEDAITGLTTGMSQATSDIASLASRVSATESGLSALATRVGTVESGLTSLTGRVGSVETGLTSLTTRMGTAEAGISSLDSRLDSVETNLASLTGRVAALESANPGILSRLDEAEDNIGHLINFTGYYDYATGTSWMQLASATGANGTTVHDSFGAARMRCIKLAVSYTSDAGQANIYEIEARMLGETNYALNATATTISNENGDPLVERRAVDGDPETRWSSDRTNPGPASVAVPHWIVLDLGQARSIDEITVGAGYYSENYIIYGRTPSGSDPCGN